MATDPVSPDAYARTMNVPVGVPMHVTVEMPATDAGAQTPVVVPTVALEADATFSNPNNLYRYTLVCRRSDGGTLQLTRGELISSVHKLIRRARTGELCYLVRAFFRAVQHESTHRSVTTALKGSISNFLNRVALSLFEEGVLLHVLGPVQHKVCTALTQAAACHLASSYAHIAEHVEEALAVVHEAHRGRLGSLVKAYAEYGRPLPDNATERALIAALHPDAVAEQATPSKFGELVKRTMLMLHTLTRIAPYKDSKEFRRVCVMDAHIAPLIPDEYKLLAPSPPLRVSIPTRDLLHDIGALEDVHTKGRQSHAAWKEFLEKGMKVANQTPVRLFGRSYGELEVLYAEGKLSDVAHGNVGQSKKRVRGPDAPHGSHKQKLANHSPTSDESAAQLTKPAHAFESEAELLALLPESKLLGFKNGSVIGTLRAATGPFAAGDRVFFKMGESAADCAFAAEVATWQERVCLPYVKTHIVHVKPSLDWWSSVTTDPSNNGDWSASLRRYLTARIKREQTLLGYMPCVVATCFEGVRVNDFTGTEGAVATQFGLSLTKNLLFAKYVGIKDVGPFNMLACVDTGRVLLVDVGKPSAAQQEEYNARGLYTSHKFVSLVDGLVMQALRDQLVSVKEFINVLHTLPCARQGGGEFWTTIVRAPTP